MRLKLHPRPEQAHTLTATLAQCTDVVNWVCAYGWEHNEKNRVRLHHATYHPVKKVCPGLVSDLVIQARVKAAEARKSAFARRKAQRKVSCPRSQRCAARYNVYTYALQWEGAVVRLSTVNGRLSIPFTIPAYATKYAGLPIDTADLVWCKTGFWLHVVVTLSPPARTSTGVCIGVDLGLRHPAVTSQAALLGKKHWKEVDRRAFRLQRALQSKGAKSAKRHLKKLSRRQQRFHRDCDHVLSKRLVQSVPPGGTTVHEDLTDIRRRVRARRGAGQRQLHAWSFAQWRQFVVYKAEEAGLDVVAIDPRHTSQTCSHCGFKHRANRRSQALFQGRHCGYTLHADLNAAKNIAAKYRASRGISSAGAPLSTGVSSPLPREERAKLPPLGDGR
jgi:putative transposase